MNSEEAPRNPGRSERLALLRRGPVSWFLGAGSMPGERQAAWNMALGAAIGVLSGGAAWGFTWMLTRVSVLAFGSPDPSGGRPEWATIAFAPLLLGLVASGLGYLTTTQRRAQTLADVVASVRGVRARLRARDGLLTAVTAALSVGGGHSGGREGPIAQLGASLGEAAADRFGLSRSMRRTLLAAGAAAGIAASFNSPLGGAFFALEIILGNFAMETFAPVVAATVAGTVVGRLLSGDEIALSLPPFQLRSPLELPFYLALGVLAGLVAESFKAALPVFRRGMERLRVPVWARGLVAGGLVSLLALTGAHGVLGNGYAVTREILVSPGSFGMVPLALLLAAKLLATAATAGGRTGAGLFAPSLVLGAIAGVLFGLLVAPLLPAGAESPGAYGMVGMGGVAAAVFHAPITMVLMLFEMTGNYQIILPLLLTLATAAATSAALGSRSLDEMDMEALGLVGEPAGALARGSLRVADVLRTGQFECVPADTPITEAIERLVERRVDTLYVMGSNGALRGQILLAQLAPVLRSPNPTGTVETYAVPALVAVRAETPLDDAAQTLVRSGLGEVPVLHGDGRMVGVLGDRDISSGLLRETLRRSALLAELQVRSAASPGVSGAQLPVGDVVRELPAPRWMVGHSLRSLALPDRFGVQVMSVRVPAPGGLPSGRMRPSADYEVTAGDVLVVTGQSAGIERLSRDEGPEPASS